MRRISAVLFVVLLAASCSSDSSETGAGTSTSSSTTAAPTTTAVAPTTTAAPTTAAPATTAAPSTTTEAPDDLPGEAFDLLPRAGAVLAVHGVAHDDVLNVRDLPGLTGDIVTTLDPLANDFAFAGRARLLPNSIWWEITTADGVTGWVSAAFTAAEGPTTDSTSFIVDQIGYVSGDSIEAVGLVVAESITDEEYVQRIVVAVPASEGDLAEITYDVVGLGDDAVSGQRLHIFLVDEDDNGTWTLRTVEATFMCHSHRGTTAEGLCS
jgi:hypothetical protein